ncbi:MAG: endonuclease [Gammaproteobacteria bacterium]
MPDRGALEHVYDTLLAAYGPQHWWPADHAFEVVVGALLIQRTAWRNAELALARLRDAGLLDPAALAAAAPAALVELVRPAGFFRQKAVRLAAVAAWFEQVGGVDGAARLEDAALRRALLALPGIGEETADAISLYAFGRPQFVVDAYLRRLLDRLGLIDGGESYGALKAAIETALPPSPSLFNEYHALVVEHGKRHCASRPRCESCVLAPRCRFRAGSR